MHTAIPAYPTRQEKPKYGGIDLMRHVLAFAVIINHVRSPSRYSAELNEMLSQFSVYDGAVFGFFLISGFLTKEQLRFSMSSAGGFLRETSRKLLLPFFLISSVDAVLMFLLGKSSLSSGLLRTVSLHGSSMQLYFLPFLFYVTIAFYFLTAVSNHWKLPVKVALLFTMALSLLLSELYRTRAATGDDLRLLPMFAICYFIGFYLGKALRCQPGVFYSAVLLLTSTCLGAGCYDHRFYVLAYVLVLFAAAVGISSLPALHNKLFPGSGGVYVLHAPIIIYAVSAILNAMGIREWPNLLLTVVLTYLISLAATLAFRAKCSRFSYLILS